jgi:aminoglycoside phosphotransferase (APT) family kinase protein
MAETGSATKQPLAREQVRALLREAVGGERDAVELSDGEFTVCYATDDLVLKVWPEAGTPLLAHEEGLVHAEIDVCRRAPEVGFPAPGLVHVDTSRRLLDRDWIVMTRLPGVSVPHAGEAVDVDRELGAALARLHEVAGDAFGYTGRPALQDGTWRGALARMLDALLDDAARFEAALPFAPEDVTAALAAAAPALDEVTRPALVHFDAWSGNVLVADGRLSGVIDGERSFYGDPLAEWAMLAFGREPADRPQLVAGYGGLELDAAARLRLDLYRFYLFAIVLVEEAPRRYDPVRRAPTRIRAAEGAVAALARLS